MQETVRQHLTPEQERDTLAAALAEAGARITDLEAKVAEAQDKAERQRARTAKQMAGICTVLTNGSHDKKVELMNAGLKGGTDAMTEWMVDAIKRLIDTEADTKACIGILMVRLGIEQVFLPVTELTALRERYQGLETGADADRDGLTLTLVKEL